MQTPCRPEGKRGGVDRRRMGGKMEKEGEGERKGIITESYRCTTVSHLKFYETVM